jgi:hypothetical protein
VGLSRNQLAAELWGVLQRTFAEVGIENSDTSGNLKEPIDATLAVLGVSYADLPTGEVADGSERAAIDVARYYGLQAVYIAATGFVDMQVDAPSIRLSKSQYVANVKAAMDACKEIASPYLPADGAWGSGSISLGFISTETEVWA